MSRRSAPLGRLPPSSLWVCLYRRIGSAAFCATRRITTRSGAPPVAGLGPRGSWFSVLTREAISLEIPIFNHTTGVRLLVAPGEKRRTVGVLAMAPKRRTPENPYGITAFLSDSVIIATGGPGELYRDSVYPRHCFGSLGLALEAGIEAVNLTESQFGIGTPRDNFPWNLSGTYVQSMPYIFSRDARGNERNFLADYYRTTQELASNIFRKGYQWPFHASRMLEFGSSLLDLAVFRENQAGRKVFMDFNRNPFPVPGDAEFSLDRLDDDVRSYLANSGALLSEPIDRLRKMNPLSIELYKRYKYDITRDPLEFAINNQHMNGGLAVDTWGATSLEGCYAVGEAAGTHGVTRPGGAALNAGQVFGTRCAEHIAARRPARASTEHERALVEEAVEATLGALRADGGLKPGAIRKDVQDRMSDNAAILCNAGDVKAAVEAAHALNEAIRQQGISTRRRQRGVARSPVETKRDRFGSYLESVGVLFGAGRRKPGRPGRLRCRRRSYPAGANRPAWRCPVHSRTRGGPVAADLCSTAGRRCRLLCPADSTSRPRIQTVL